MIFPIPSFLNPVGNFLKRIPDWVMWVVAAVVFWKFVDMTAEGRGRKKAEARAETDKAEAELATVETIRTIERTEHDRADQAVAARDASPVSVDVGQLSADQAARIFKD